MARNAKYSFKDLTYQDLTGEPAKDFNNSEIVGSCFHQHEPDTKVFPAGMTGVTFQKCNLDNCHVPVGNTVEGGCHRWVAKQNDGEMWFVDNDMKPLSPTSPSYYTRLKLSVDPAGIPALPLAESVLETKQKELDESKELALKAAEDIWIAANLGGK